MSYGGDLTPGECWNLLQTRPQDAILVDVRTTMEWQTIGVPVTESPMLNPVFREWQRFPDMSIDPGFPEHLDGDLKKLGATNDAHLCFLCRSGVRSLSAAKVMAAHNYPNSFNVTGGFEGDPDAAGQRGNINGWQFEGLPWGHVQSALE